MPAYPGISSDAFRHPLDREAEQALRSVPGFDLVARKFVEFMYERPQTVYLMGNHIQVGPRQYATLYHILRECVQSLDLSPEPTLFVCQNPVVNSYALGEERACVVVNSGLLDLMDEAELRSVIAHELGHIKCGHTTLIQMAMWVMSAIETLGDLTMGLGNLVGSSLLYAFYEWRRKAELSADRAALLVTDDFQTVTHSMMQLAGGSQRYSHECSLEEFIAQSGRYRELDADGLNQVYKFLLYNGGMQGAFLSHPFPVERVHYLQEWANSAEYRQIRAGHYRRSPTPNAVDVSPAPPTSNRSEVEALQRQIEELQQEINRIRSQS